MIKLNHVYATALAIVEKADAKARGEHHHIDPYLSTNHPIGGTMTEEQARAVVAYYELPQWIKDGLVEPVGEA